MWAWVGARRALAHTFGVRVRGRGGMGGYIGDETVANVYGLSHLLPVLAPHRCARHSRSAGAREIRTVASR